MSQVEWRGVFPALTTKFSADGSFDWEAMSSHLEFQLDAGVHGIVILGSLGENSTMDKSEKAEVVRFFASAERRGRPLIVTLAERSTRRACEFAESCEKAGAHGLMVLPPMGYQGDKRETLAYLRAVADASSLPIMLYNNPIAYGTDLTPADFADLADNPCFQAIKESSGDTRRITEIQRLTGDRYAIYCGIDDLAFECLSLGAVGWIAGLVVAFPHETVRIFELMQMGKWREARAIYDWFLPLLALDTGPFFIHQIKLVEELVGVGNARLRPPRLQLPDARIAEIKGIVDRALESRPAL
ncbi:MAG TPA: dihydrodipicolinate synthase family protein [Xanthomonadales bacterium]|nr:dihydrodipicolinate synthase family protein [Xanthomonadales bacterium]